MPNTLYYGDNLDVLRDKIASESVDLCYIDPPFNSKRNYNQIYNNIGGEDRAQAQAFIDTWTWDDHAEQGIAEILTNHGARFTSETIDLIGGLAPVLKKGPLLAYLIAMTLRAVEIRRVLKPQGSFYLHCDPTASHYLKIILDAIFVAGGINGGDYRNEIIWKRHEGHSDAKRFGVTHDVIFYYIKTRQAQFKKVFTDFSPQQLARYRPDENGRLYTGQDLTAAGVTPLRTVEWRGVHPGANRHWMWSIEQMERLLADGLILLREDGKPRKDGYKVYLDEKAGKTVGDVWDDIGRIANTSGERLGYPTQKPESLLERIISASSNPGDVVLDAFCGCGTTITVAHRLKRQWIGIDITYQSIALMKRRLEEAFPLDQTIKNEVVYDGIPRDMASAQALALKKDDRVRKEFEKWAVLSYSDGRAAINEKKGADAGIDGVAYFLTGASQNAKMVFQVKSGKVGRGDIAKLNSDRQREKAELATFITLNEPTRDMIQEAKGMGFYEHPQKTRQIPRVSIVTVREMLENDAHLDLPMSLDVLKRAQLAQNTDQLSLLGE